VGGAPRTQARVPSLVVGADPTASVALLEQAAVAYRHNQRGIVLASARRRIATSVLFAGATATLGAIAFVVGGAIHG